MIRIENTAALARTPARADAIAIAQAAYDAIDTDRAVRSALQCDGTILQAGGASYDLSHFSRVRIIGFGKASCRAAQAIESVLHSHVTDGVVLDISAGTCEVVLVEQGSHPRPSSQNVSATERIVKIAADSNENDLVIVAVSGGGSSLLCWPAEECDQGARFFDDAQRSGMPIGEMNIVRRHLSAVKGGGLAAILHPATVIALVFCDVPGDHFEDVASGPTYFDPTTAADAQQILDRYGLGGYALQETPKDHSLFDRIRNVPVVSNTTALAAMKTRAQELGYRVAELGAARYDGPDALVRDMIAALDPGTVAIAGGEITLKVADQRGKGGRCTQLALTAAGAIAAHDVFLPFASDGIDNCDAAGAIVDASTSEKARAQNLSIEEHLAHFDPYVVLAATGDLLFTGPTEANVSDLYLALRPRV